MGKRLYLRAGEIATLYGEDSSRTEWSIWNDMMSGDDGGAGEFGRWQARLMQPIMAGIAEDHGLKIGRQLGEGDQGAACPIMPPKAWAVAPSMITGGRPSVMVVMQKTGQSLRDWKEPGQIPAKHLRRLQAIGAVYGTDDVLLGVLVDGYSSQLYHVHAGADVRDDICARARDFVRSVEVEEEPDVDFSKDESAIRKGVAMNRTEASTETVEALLSERAGLVARRPPIDTSLKQLDARMREIDTTLIHLAGKDGRLEVGQRLVTVTRDGKQNPKVAVIDRAAAPLF